MKLILNTIIQPIFELNNCFYYKLNNDFIEIENYELIKFILKIFKENKIISKLKLIQIFCENFEIKFSEAEEIIDNLIENSLLTEYCEKDRYFTNTLFFSIFNNLEKLEFQKKIKNTEVCILGLGGSTLIIQQLAQIGIGKITGIDFDTLEASNLNRQSIFKEKDLGKLKNEVLLENLKEINSELIYDFKNIYVTSGKDIKEIIKTADIVILALDEPIIDSSIWIYDECKNQKKKIISGGVFGDTVTYIYCDYADKTLPCYRCSFEEDLTKNEIVKNYLLNIKGKKYSNFNTTTIFVGSILASIISTEIVKIITNYSSPLKSHEVLTLNTTNWEIKKEKLKINKYCEVCKNKKKVKI